jgi:GntR family transcriptional regulator
MTVQQRQVGRTAAGLFAESSGKLYVELAALLRRRIREGLHPAGSRLPSIDELAQTFDVAPVTVRNAVALLEDEGLVRRRQGRGTFVSDRSGPHGQLLLSLESNWESLLSRIDSTCTRLLSSVDALNSPLLEPDDGIPPRAFRRLRRLHSAQSTPYAVLDIHLDAAIYRRAPRRFEQDLVIPTLERLPGLRLASAHQRLTIGTADLEAASLLRVPVNAPVGEVRRVLIDEAQRIVYVGLAIYRADAVRLERRIVPIPEDPGP